MSAPSHVVFRITAASY